MLTFILSFVCQSSTNSYQFPIVQLYTYQRRKEIVRVLYSIVKKKKKSFLSQKNKLIDFPVYVLSFSTCSKSMDKRRVY